MTFDGNRKDVAYFHLQLKSQIFCLNIHSGYHSVIRVFARHCLTVSSSFSRGHRCIETFCLYVISQNVLVEFTVTVLSLLTVVYSVVVSFVCHHHFSKSIINGYCTFGRDCVFTPICLLA